MRRPTDKRLLYIHPDPYPARSDGPTDNPWELLDTEEAEATLPDATPKARPRLVDEHWIDLDPLKAWLTDGERDHSPNCDPTPDETLQWLEHFILINVELECLQLVSGADGPGFMALSYVRGGGAPFTVTHDSLAELCVPGALRKQQHEKLKLPKTFAQSMALVKELGEQYLWIDALCIVDDDDEKEQQYYAMASIFRSATLVIVAADGEDAHTGFRGLPNISAPRKSRQLVAPLSQRQKLVRATFGHNWGLDCLKPWSDDGWAYQALRYSRGRLYLANDTIRASCESSFWSEESTSSNSVADYGTWNRTTLHPRPPATASSMLPSLDEYGSVVNALNIKSFPSVLDPYWAFAGIGMELSKKFIYSFICGIPIYFFHIALLWRPRHGDMYRRLPAASEQEAALPSWSWMGWHGGVTFPYTWEGHDDPAGPLPMFLGGSRTNRRIGPIQVSDVNGARPWAMVDASWWVTSRHIENGDFASRGWTKRTPTRYPGMDHLAMEWYTRLDREASFWKHESDPKMEFCLPVWPCGYPMRPRLQRYLHFTTASAHFKLGEVRRHVTRILTLDGKPAGTLWHHDKQDPDFVRATLGPVEERTSVEMILISNCVYPREEGTVWDDADLDRDEHLGPKNMGQVFSGVTNALWIGRDGNNVAFRKGVAEIDEYVWDASEPDLVEIVLA